MHISILPAFLLAQLVFSVPVDQAPGADLVIRGWNTTTQDCDYKNAHLYGEMGPSEDVWGDGGNYTSYSISRALQANESLELYAFSGGNYCGEFLYNDLNTAPGCYSYSAGFSCMKMGSS